ncbi:hypothetical protein Q3G72_027369 [Acer saccharum]|nr:hypothetical protein Q3G72_027369 [Acer saccharum]
MCLNKLVSTASSLARATVDHSQRLMHPVTWNRSLKGIQNGEVVKDNYDSEEYETHATDLDKLLAWEKKLYEEVKIHFT